MSAQNVTLRNIPELPQARRIARKYGTTLTNVVSLSLQHGLPLVEEKLAGLKPQTGRKSSSSATENLQP